MKKKYAANRFVERAADIIFDEAEDETNKVKTKNLFRLLRALALRMMDKGTVPMPMIDKKGVMGRVGLEKLAAGDIFTIPEDMPLCMELLQNGRGENYLPIFTDEEELNQGIDSMQADVVLAMSIRNIIRACVECKEVDGIVVNAFGKEVVLEREKIESFWKIYNVLKGNRTGASMLWNIYDALDEDNRLPQAYAVPCLGSGQGVEDAAYIYGGRKKEKMKEAYKNLMKQGLRYAASSDKSERAKADCCFARIGLRYGIANVLEEIQNYILWHRDELNIKNCYAYVKEVLKESINKEVIKAALVILEMMKEDPGENVKEMVRLLGRANEFTIFVAYNMRYWKKSRKELAALQRNVYGLGKKHVRAVWSLELEK